MNNLFVLSEEFRNDGRGPELIYTYYAGSGSVIKAIDYYNPDDLHDAQSIKHLRFLRSQAHMFTPEEVYNYSLDLVPWQRGQAAAVNLGKSAWLESFAPLHLLSCQHYRLMFYDQILDVICEGIEARLGSYRAYAMVIG